MPQTSTSEEDYVPATKKLKLADKYTQTTYDDPNQDQHHLDYIREYREVKEFLLKNTGMEFWRLMPIIGIPAIVLDMIEDCHPRNVSRVLSSACDRWYPVAERIAGTEGMTPRQIIAYGYKTIDNRVCFDKLLNETEREFVLENDCLCELVTDKIFYALESSISVGSPNSNK